MKELYEDLRGKLDCFQQLAEQLDAGFTAAQVRNFDCLPLCCCCCCCFCMLAAPCCWRAWLETRHVVPCGKRCEHSDHTPGSPALPSMLPHRPCVCLTAAAPACR
jgi:hypothetical protein